MSNLSGATASTVLPFRSDRSRARDLTLIPGYTAAHQARGSESTYMKAIAALFALTLAGCGGSEPSNGAVTPAPSATDSRLPASGAFIGRVWISTAPGHALGEMIVFLPDRTLLMDSCFETYRISEWGVAGDHVRWREDSIPLEAAVSLPSNDELTLQIVGREHPQTYLAASAPYVCPDMPK